MVDLSTHRVLGRHVEPLADDGRLGLLGDRRHRHAEVEELHGSVEPEHHVVRRDIAVDDGELLAGEVARPVRVMQRLRDLAHDVAHGAERQHGVVRAERLDDVAEILAAHVLHREVERAADLADVEHLHDVGVHEAAGDFGLVQEHVDRLMPALEQLALDPLERDGLLEPAEPDLLREEHLGHAACGQPANDLVLAENRVVERRGGLGTGLRDVRVGERSRQQLFALRDDLGARRRRDRVGSLEQCEDFRRRHVARRATARRADVLRELQRPRRVVERVALLRHPAAVGAAVLREHGRHRDVVREPEAVGGMTQERLADVDERDRGHLPGEALQQPAPFAQARRIDLIDLREIEHALAFGTDEKRARAEHRADRALDPEIRDGAVDELDDARRFLDAGVERRVQPALLHHASSGRLDSRRGVLREEREVALGRLVELELAAAARALFLGNAAADQHLAVGVHVDRLAGFDAARRARVRRDDRQHVCLAAEVQDHVELVDEERRAAEQVHVADGLGERFDALEPLADAERRHPRHARDVDDHVLGISDLAEAGKLLVDETDHVHHRHVTRSRGLDGCLRA